MLRMMHEGHDGTLAGRLAFTPEGFVLPNKMRLGYNLLQPDGQSGFKYIADARSYRKAVANRVTGEEGGGEWTKIYGGKVVENCVQALAAIVIREQMVALRLLGYDVAFQVHDEIVVVAPESMAEVYEAKVVEVMSTPPKWAPDLPVACESGVAVNYGDT